MRKIVLITSGQPSLNPRLVKEADALTNSGYNVTVIYQYWNRWGTEMDKALLAKKSWKAIRVGGSPDEDKFTYWYSRLIHKKNQLFSKYFPNLLTEFSISRCTKLLLKEAVKHKTDLYIAHNLGALPVAVISAKKNKAKVGFDAEDFHRQEVTDDTNSKAYQLVKFTEDKYLPEVDYLITASPLIGEAYQKLYPNLKPIVINNVFSGRLSQKVNPSNQNKELNLFWFSQTIGKGRGLEDAIKAVASLNKEHITLTLLGNIDNDNRNYFLQLAEELNLKTNQLTFIKPILPDDIFKLASKFDIGLALEPGFCVNNDIALSNKIFTYLTSGLTVIATETLAQKAFIEENPSVGKSYPIGNSAILANIINEYDQNRDLLYQTKQKALELSKTKYNWEMESKNFLELIKSQF